MAAILSRASTRALLSYSKSSPPLTQRRPSHILTRRHRSNKSGKGRLVEVDLESTVDGGGEIESVMGGVRRLEDVIHNIIVRRSAPDWLPFLPGSSYWVPPSLRRRGPAGVVEMIGRVANPRTEEEILACSSVRGWPSSDYFIHGGSRSHPVPVEVQVVELKFEEDSDNESQPEEEER